MSDPSNTITPKQPILTGNPSPKIWINAGEISGDMHGAALLKALKKRLPDMRCIGMGGPALEAEGMKTIFRVEELSVMGFIEVFSKLPKVFSLLRGIKAALAHEKPDLLICIDAASFNFRVIKAARKLGIPVLYHISPKIWAWGSGRGHFIKKNVHRLISILPFEPEFYQRFGMQVDYVGNPLVDLVNLPALEHIKSVPGRIGLLPGSRRKEITSLMPRFAGAAKIMRDALRVSQGQTTNDPAQDQNSSRESAAAAMPELEFHCVAAPSVNPEQLRQLWEDNGGSGIPLHLHGPEKRYELMRSCQMIIAASGTATLECALVGVPTLITYVVSSLTFFLGKTFVQVKYAGLPNLILDRELFPELLQEDCLPEPLAEAALRWIDPARQQAMREGKLPGIWKGSSGPREFKSVLGGLDELHGRMGAHGAVDRAAAVVEELLNDIAR